MSKYILLLSSLLLMMLSCQEEIVPSITVNQTEFDVSGDGGSQTIAFESNVNWTAKSSENWCSISSPSSGDESTKSITVALSANDTYDARSCTVTITAGTVSKTVSINQAQKEAIILTNKTQNLSSESHLLEVELKTNVDFEVIIPEAAKSWVSYTGTRALRTEILLINIATNDSYDARTADIYIKNKATDLQETLTINQSAHTGLLVTQNKYNLSNDAATIEVEVKANVEFDVIIANEWITKTTTRGLPSTKINFNIAKNISHDNREGTIIIKQKNGTLTSTITVFQSQQDAIILSKKTQNLSSSSQSLEVELKTNVDFEVIIPPAAKTWVSYVSTRALRTETLLLNIIANEGSQVRTTQIFVKNKVSNLQDTLTIIQDKAADLPTLTTVDAYDIFINSAKSGGKISKDGGAPILAKGVCWSTTENPTIEKSNKKDGLGDVDFTVSLTDLTVATKYYARAYATNRSGTSYGNQIIFTTTSTVATPVISPIGGIYTSPQSVTIISATDGTQIRYTLNGSEPIETSLLYSGEILVNEGMTIKAKAFKANWVASGVTSQSYTIIRGTQLIEGTSSPIQHIETTEDFTFRLNNLDNKEVFFIFSNVNTKNTTLLPQLQSNVAKMDKAEKLTAYSEPSFVVSGKPSISDFNNDPLKYPMKGMEKAQYQKYSISQPEKLVIGSSELFYDEAGATQLSTVRKVISAHGKNLIVWVANNCWESGGTKSYNVTQKMIDEFAPKFLNTGANNDIYEWVTNIGGAPWGNSGFSNLIPNTDDIHIWLTDIDNDNKSTGQVTIGYFFARDNFLKSSIATSNEKLMFTLDAVLFGKTSFGTTMISALAHEFTHMIYYYQNNILNGLTGNSAINEMSAQCVEDLLASKIFADGPRGVKYDLSDAGKSGNYTGRLPLYNSNNDFNLLDWSNNQTEILLNYSKTYAFGAYLMRNFGGANLIKELIQNKSTGVNSIVAAVNSNGGVGLSYGDILQRFGAANLLSDKTTMTAGYKLNTGTWSTSTINGITYDLGSINLYNYPPTPNVYNVLPMNQNPGSNIYYRAGSNLNGEKEWSFKGMSTDTKLTVVIK